MPWDRASRLKSASQRSKLPVFLQFGWAKAGALASSRAAVASVPIPKFANTRGPFACELLNPRDTSNFMILVPLLNPKFAIGLAALACELRVWGTSPNRCMGQGPWLSVPLFAEDERGRKRLAVDMVSLAAMAACWSCGISPILMAVRRKRRASPAVG